MLKKLVNDKAVWAEYKRANVSMSAELSIQQLYETSARRTFL